MQRGNKEGELYACTIRKKNTKKQPSHFFATFLTDSSAHLFELNFRLLLKNTKK